MTHLLPKRGRVIVSSLLFLLLTAVAFCRQQEAETAMTCWSPINPEEVGALPLVALTKKKRRHGKLHLKEKKKL